MANDTVDYSKFTADKIKAAEEAAQKIKDAPDLATAREHILSLPTQEMGGPQASLGAYTPNAAMDQQAKLQADKQAAYAAGQGMQPMIGTRPANANVQAIRQSPDVSNQMPSVSSGQTLPPSPPVAYTAPQPQFGANGLDNANQFDQQQLEQLNKQGKLSYQDYLKALQNAAPMPPLDTTPKKREDLRYGTDVHGNPIVPDASKISPNLPPAPPAPLPASQAEATGGPANTPFTTSLQGQRSTAGTMPASKADADLLRKLNNEQGQSDASAAQAIDPTRAVAQGFQQQAAANLNETNLAQMQFQAKQKEDADKFAAIQQDRKQRETQQDIEMADLKSQHIDPNRYFKNQSTGQKILGGIGLLLGGLGGAVSHGQNSAVQVIQSAINQDIDAQKTDLQKRVDILGKRITRDRSALDVQSDLLKAEQDGTYRAYNATIQTIQNKMGMAKDNVQAQQNGINAIKLLQNDALDRANKLDLQIHQLEKQKELQSYAAANAGRVNPQVARDWIVDRKKFYIEQKMTEREAAEAADRDAVAKFGLSGAKESAPSNKTEAERLLELKEKLKNNASGMGAIGQDVASSSIFSNPASWATTGIQNTEGFKDKTNRGVANLAIIAQVHRKTGLRGEAAVKEAESQGLLLKDNDTTTTLQQKLRNAAKLAGQADAPQATINQEP